MKLYYVVSQFVEKVMSESLNFVQASNHKNNMVRSYSTATIPQYIVDIIYSCTYV